MPVEKEKRQPLLEATASDTIPALVFDNGETAVGEDAIMRLLEATIVESGEAEAHRQKAARARRRYLEEECECSQRATTR